MLAQRLTDLQSMLDRQGERLGALAGEVKAGLATSEAALGGTIQGFAIEQAKLLNDWMLKQATTSASAEKAMLEALTTESARSRDVTAEQTKALNAGMLKQIEALAAMEKAVLERLATDAAALTDRLALDAKATREAIAEQRQAVTKALAEHKDDTALLRRDVTQGIAEIRLAFAEGLAKLQQTLSAENTRGRDLLDTKLKELREGNEARLAAIQKTVDEQLQSAVEKQMKESFARVTDQFAQVLKAMTDVQAVTTQIVDIKRLFSNVKTRGGWGEAQLRALIEDILPLGSYEANKKLSDDSAELVEFAVRMPAEAGREIFLPIDAKFPTEDWERLVIATEAGDAEGEKSARRALEARVRGEAQKISAKYIHPPLTVEFAVLFLPTEGLYAEIARIPGAIEEIRRKHRVFVMGPSILPAMLQSIRMGHMTITLGEKAEAVRELLGATKFEMRQMDEFLRLLGKQVRTMGNTIDRAQVRTRAVERKLRSIDAMDGSRAAALLDIEAAELMGEGDEA
ncbi:DNA recombination protein RmuC [Neoroseomonas terrae]